MFSTTTVNNAIPKQRAEELFTTLVNSTKLATQANNVLEKGVELLNESVDLTRIELDKIIIGTILFALYQDHFKYYYNSNIPKQLHAETFQQIMNEMNELQAFPNNIIKNSILSIGKKVLEDKTIAFNGIFSQVNDIQSMITTGLPFMTSDYLEAYDIKPAKANSPHFS